MHQDEGYFTVIKNMRVKSPKNPEDTYVDSAIRHHELLISGDPKGSNKAHDHLIAAARKLRVREDRGLAFLTHLLGHENESVRLWAACHRLPLDEKMALKNLAELASRASAWQLQTDAEMTMTEWLAGRLDVDWFMKK